MHKFDRDNIRRIYRHYEKAIIGLRIGEHSTFDLFHNQEKQLISEEGWSPLEMTALYCGMEREEAGKAIFCDLPTESHTTLTYLIKRSSDQHDAVSYKIGRSKHPERRLRQIQDGCCDDYEIVGTIAADIELALHRTFKEFNIGKEWFIFDDDTLNNKVLLFFK